MSLAGALERTVGQLVGQQARFALVGGLAVSVRTEPRFTRDIDLAVAVGDDAAAEDSVRALIAGGFELDSSVEQLATGRLAGVRLRPPGDAANLVDLLFASSGIEPEVVIHAEALEVFVGVTVPVAATGHLISLKLLARDDDERPQDGVDLRMLARSADETDWRLARRGCQDIVDRGFHRGRDLMGMLEDLRGR